MEVQIKELRERPGHYIKLAEAGAEIIITSHGAQKARLVPMDEPKTTARGRHFNQQAEKKGFLFGIWGERNDMQDVPEYVRSLREGRSF